MTELIYCGIDPSLTSTGVVLIDKDYNIKKEFLISTTNQKQINDIEKRFIQIQEMLRLDMISSKVANVCIEGISYGSKGEGFAQLAALHYLIRILLFNHSVKFQVVPPTTLKKFVTGKGNVKKNIMIKEIYKKWNVDYNDDNMADAYALARMALVNT